MRNSFTIKTSLEFFLDMLSVYRNTVTAYRANFMVIIPIALGTFHDRSASKLRPLGPSPVRMVCFQSCYSRCLFHFRLPDHCFQTLGTDLLSEAVSSSSSLSVDCSSLALYLESFSNKSLRIFLFYIKRLSTASSASPSGKMLSAGGLATSSLCGSNTYSTSSEMFVWNCPLMSE